MISQGAFAALEKPIRCLSVGELRLKGFYRPMTTFEIVGVGDRPRAETLENGEKDASNSP